MISGYNTAETYHVKNLMKIVSKQLHIHGFIVTDLKHKYEREFAENPSYVHLYRKGNAYHGVHPFYMWYWGENGRQHVGKVIVAGAENNHVPALLGWDRTDTLTEAIEEARGFMGRSATISLLRIAPTLLADVKL